MKSGEIYLRHILEEMLFLEEHSRRITFDELRNDEILKRSFLRSIEVIGEASKNIPAFLFVPEIKIEKNQVRHNPHRKPDTAI